jgi:hypothetical protein
MPGCTTDLFIAMIKTVREFGIHLTPLNEYIWNVLASALCLDEPLIIPLHIKGKI